MDFADLPTTSRIKPVILRVKRRLTDSAPLTSLLVKRPRVPIQDDNLPVDNQSVNKRFVHKFTSDLPFDKQIIKSLVNQARVVDAQETEIATVQIGLVVQRDEGDEEAAAGPSAKRPRSYHLDAVQQQMIDFTLRDPCKIRPATPSQTKAHLKRSAPVSGQRPSADANNNVDPFTGLPIRSRSNTPSKDGSRANSTERRTKSKSPRSRDASGDRPAGDKERSGRRRTPSTDGRPPKSPRSVSREKDTSDARKRSQSREDRPTTPTSILKASSTSNIQDNNNNNNNKDGGSKSGSRPITPVGSRTSSPLRMLADKLFSRSPSPTSKAAADAKSSRKQVQFGQAMTCNGQPAVQVQLPAKPQQPKSVLKHPDWVYDYYVLEQANVQMARGTFVRADEFGELHGYYDDKIMLHESEPDDDELEERGFVAEEDSDENAEDNWRNDYPDDESDASSEESEEDLYEDSITKEMRRMQLAGHNPSEYIDDYFGPGAARDREYAHWYGEEEENMSDIDY